MDIKHSPYVTERRTMRVIRRSWELRVIEAMTAERLAEAARIIPPKATLVLRTDFDMHTVLTFELSEEVEEE